MSTLLQIDAEKLQRLRRDTGLSIEAFAAQAGVSDQTVRRWEAGMRHQRTPRVTRLKRVTDTLSRLLGRQILPSDLLVRPEDPTTAEEDAAAA